MSFSIKDRVLAVDDSPLITNLITKVLGDKVTLTIAHNGLDALKRAETEEYDVYLVDLLLPGMSGLELIKKLKAMQPKVVIIVISQTEDIDTVISVFREQVFNYLRKPIKADILEQEVLRALKFVKMERQVEALTRVLSNPNDSQPYIGPSPVMQKLWTQTKVYATVSRNEPILITGETGTGKELVARALHQWGRRKDSPFISVNCSLLDGQMASSELFGVAKGVATGVEPHAGKFEAAQCGTLFLDEVGELPLETQAKLLRVVQEETFSRIGSNKEMTVDFRLVAATNRNLERYTINGRFRDDLYYRLNVLPIHVPALRERKEDIPGLVAYFLAKHSKRIFGKDTMTIEPHIIERMLFYPWPGNVRQLENTIIRILVTGDVSVLDKSLVNPTVEIESSDSVKVFGKTWIEIEREILQRCLTIHHGKINLVADMLDISKSSIYEKVKRYDLQRD